MNNAVRNTEFRARVTQLGYLGIGISDIVAWRDFAENVLGVQISDETEDGSLFLRTDAYHHRLILRPTGEDDVVFVGWEVKDAEALDLMAQQIRAYGLAVIEGTPEDCAERMVLGLIKFIDPDGLAVEIYYGGRLDHRPFVSPRGVRGFAADGLGLGHIVLAADEPVSYVAFYMDVLGTRLSDYILFSTPERQAKVAFMHVNPRHHSLAVSPRRAAQPGAPAQKRISHFMLELKDIDDVGVALSLFTHRGIPAGALGRHTNDKMISFYGATPSGFNVEYGFGGLQILDEGTWEVQHHRAASIWGHGVPRPAAANA